MEARVVVELDGPHHTQQVEADEERTRVIESCGWLVLRFDNERLDDDHNLDRVLGEIGDACERGRG